MKTKMCMILCVLAAISLFCGQKKEVIKPQHPMNIGKLKPEFPIQGRIVFQSDMDGDREIFLLTKSGVRRLTDNNWDDEYPKWSPDGTKIAFSANPNGNYDIFVMDEDGSNVRALISSPKNEVEHAWFPDGQKMAYTIEEKKGIRRQFMLWEMDLNTKKSRKMLPSFKGNSALPDFAPNAPLMAFTGKKMMGWDVFITNMQEEETKDLTSGGKACRPHFSGNGTRIAYVSAEADGKGDIWLMNPDGGAKTRLTERNETSDYFPAWAPNDEYIVFSSSLEHRIDRGNWSLYLVKVRTKEIFPLFDSPGRDIFPDWK